MYPKQRSQHMYSNQLLKKPDMKTAKEWEKEILLNLPLNVGSPLTEVKQSELITDVRELFGHDLKGKVSLRTAQDHRQGQPIRLKQFQPNFRPGKVICRHPSCKNVKPEAVTGKGKRDLYLCPGHRMKLGDFIEKMCARKKVTVEVSFNPDNATFDGYTSMIGYLDYTYRDCMTSFLSPGWRTKPMVKEAILNVRNYLVIVNAVLNPDEENLGIALPPVYQILIEILQNCRSREFVQNLVQLLKEVVRTILFAFGVVYTWVSVALSGPGAQIGAGLGGIIGGVVGVFCAGPAGAAGGAAGGAVCGGLIGNGIRRLIRGQRQNDDELQEFRAFWNQGPPQGGAGILAVQDADGQNQDDYPVFSFTGSVWGDLALGVMWVSFLTGLQPFQPPVVF